MTSFTMIARDQVYEKSRRIHPRIAVEMRKITDINTKEEDIIIKHMWGATFSASTKESFVMTR